VIQPNRRALLQTAAALTIPLTITPALNATAGSATAANVKPADSLYPRERLLLDFDWRFAFGHSSEVHRDFGFGADQKTFAKQGTNVSTAADIAFDDSTWKAVNLPHDWVIDLPFVKNEYFIPPKNPDDGDAAAGHGYKAVGRNFPETSIGWYRKVFHIAKADEAKRLTIEFDGIFRDATIIFNGYILTRHNSGYCPATVDISNFINVDGPNVLLVRADASLGEGWFYEGAGIYRHVWLVKTARTYIPQWGVCVRSDTSGALSIETDVTNATDEDRELRVISTVYDRDRRVAAKLETPLPTGARQSTSCRQTATLAPVRLWALDDPHLYTVHTELMDGETVIDTCRSRFGVRDIRFDSKDGFFLNGQWLKIKGTNNHQDHAGVGIAIPDSLQTWRVKQLKEMGSNTWRCSHNPPTPELLDACDELGMLVIDETRMMTSTPTGLEELETLIRRDRNHPSIILWSIGNEETAQQGTERGLKIALDMRRVVKSLDPTRPVTAAMNHFMGQGITPALDVMGFNYHEADIEPFRKLYPDMPIVGTETASAVSTRGEYVRDEAKGYVRAYDLDAPSYALTAEAWWTLYNSKSYLSGGLVWTGFDYRGEPTPFNRWPEISSHFGILDTCGFPKDIYYYYKSWWQTAPVLHLFPHWNWEGKEGKDIPVWVHSNLDAVELFVNGKSVGQKSVVKDRHLEWQVPYTPGSITAYGYKNGKVVMKQTRKTAGPAWSVTLTADQTTLMANGQDVIMLKADVLDRAGVPVPTADNLIHFDVEGPATIIGVGNGNPTSHEADRASSRMAFNGLAQAILQGRRKEAGGITVVARSNGLVSGRLTLKALEVTPLPQL
jgi:beta-galactosidase